MKQLFYLSLFLFLGLASMSSMGSLYAQQPVVTDGWSSDSNCSVNGGSAGVNCYIANPPSLLGDDNGIIEANAFENVYEFGDVLVVMRFRLPVKDLPLLNNPKQNLVWKKIFFWPKEFNPYFKILSIFIMCLSV